MASLLAGLGSAERDQADQRLPVHQQLHLSKSHLKFAQLVCSGELIIRKAELVAGHPPCGSQHKCIMTMVRLFFCKVSIDNNGTCNTSMPRACTTHFMLRICTTKFLTPPHFGKQ